MTLLRHGFCKHINYLEGNINIGKRNNMSPRKRGLSDTKSTKTTRSMNQTGKPSVPEALMAPDDPRGGARGWNNTPRAHKLSACGTAQKACSGT